jgi:hypothetical protein
MEELGLGYPISDTESEHDDGHEGAERTEREEHHAYPSLSGAVENGDGGLIVDTGPGGGGEDGKGHDNMSLDYKLLDELYRHQDQSTIHQQYSELEMLAKAGEPQRHDSESLAFAPHPLLVIGRWG